MKKLTTEDVINIIKNMDLDSDIEKVDPSKVLADQGLDSLDMMNLYFELEEAFSIKITEESLQNHNWFTVDAIVKNVNNLLAP